MSNYICLTSSKLSRYKQYMYVDCNYLADDLFIKNKITVKFEGDFTKDDSDYIFVYCKVKKKDHDKFIKTLGELKNKMLIMGYSDYESFCEEQINKILCKLN
mgnify:FL=1